MLDLSDFIPSVDALSGCAIEAEAELAVVRQASPSLNSTAFRGLKAGDEEFLARQVGVHEGFLDRMSALFLDLQERESRWRDAVYSGEDAYTREADERLRNSYRRWAGASYHLLKAAEVIEELSGSRIRGTGSIRDKLRLVVHLLSDPPYPLIDRPRIGLDLVSIEGDRPDGDDQRSHSLDETTTARVQEGFRSVREGRFRPLSDYLDSRPS